MKHIRLILVRHGETIANRDGLNQGQQGGTLTPKGKEQALAVADTLSTMGITRIYASDLNRVQESLAPLHDRCPDVPIETTKELREQDMGAFEDSPYGSVINAAREAGEEVITFRPGEGETILERATRVNRFVDKLIDAYGTTEETILLYTHGGCIVDALVHILEAPRKRYSDFGHDNAHYSIIDIGTERRLVDLNVAAQRRTSREDPDTARNPSTS